MTEEKIREAFIAHRKLENIRQDSFEYYTFRAGYLALLNSLEYVFAETKVNKTETLYRLPEGVTRES